MIVRLLSLLLSAALAADPLTWGEPLEATVEKEQWQDFYVDVADDDVIAVEYTPSQRAMCARASRSGNLSWS